MQESKSHTCTYESCKAAFDRPYRLYQHLLVHKNIKAFPCQQEGCKKAYTSKSHLDRHIHSAHKPREEIIIYSCPKCLKSFANRQNLIRHWKIAHLSSNDTFSCSECYATFKKKHQLSTHMYIHTGIKAFSCNLCPERFVTLQEKKRHVKFHKTYVCDDCFVEFNHWSVFQKHKKTEHAEKEYICDFCQRSFKNRQHIVHHIKIHFEPSPVMKLFVCPYDNCTREYTRKTNLKQHIEIKHEKVTHNCTICDAKLSTKARLCSHMKIHERTEPLIIKPKTKATGRKKRRDKNVAKKTEIFKIVDLIQGRIQEGGSVDPDVSD